MRAPLRTGAGSSGRPVQPAGRPAAQRPGGAGRMRFYITLQEGWRRPLKRRPRRRERKSRTLRRPITAATRIGSRRFQPQSAWKRVESRLRFEANDSRNENRIAAGPASERSSPRACAPRAAAAGSPQRWARPGLTRMWRGGSPFLKMLKNAADALKCSKMQRTP